MEQADSWWRWYSEVLAESRQRMRISSGKPKEIVSIFPICGQCQDPFYLLIIRMNMDRFYSNNYPLLLLHHFCLVFRNNLLKEMLLSLQYISTFSSKFSVLDKGEVRHLSLQYLLFSCSHYFNRLIYWFHFLLLSG